MALKLGKREFVEDPKDLKLASFIDRDRLPSPPEVFTFADTVEDGEWGMLMNDSLGDCAPAMALHAQEVFGRLGEHHPEFNDACVERAYSEMGGYVVGDAATDQGCYLRDVAKVWQKTGVPDVNGHRHHCGAYVWLEPGNVEELWIAVNLFKAGLLGYQLPQNAMDASEGATAEDSHIRPLWDYDAGSPTIGGHAVPSFGRIEDPGEGPIADSVSWGARVNITPAFIENHMDEGFVVVTSSVLGGDGQIEGLDHEKLLADLKQLEVEFA